MYLLTLFQNDLRYDIALFENKQNGRKFLKNLPGYNLKHEIFEDIDLEYETINLKDFPEYIELEYNGNIIPFTKYMFPDDTIIDVEWLELPNLEQKNNKIIEGHTLVDAYFIDNNELKEYLSIRERKYQWAKEFLKSKGYKVQKSFFGSEDGEAIVIKSHNQNEWHFFTHIDPIFVEQSPNEKKEFKKYIEDLMIE